MSRSETIKRTLRRKVEGGFHATSIPYGYCSDGMVAQLDPKLAPIIRGAIERAAEGWTLSKIQAWLLLQGFRTRHGKVPSAEFISKMVTNPFYAGYVRLNGVLYLGRHEPVVAMPVIEQVLGQLRARVRGHRV